MRLVAIFEDTPAMLAVRRDLAPQHLAFLREHADEILIGGGLREAPSQAYVGGMWVLAVASRERAVELIEADPYFKAEPRPYRLLCWGKAIPEAKVVL